MSETMTAVEARHFDRFSMTNAAIVAEAFPCGCEAYRDVFTYRRWQAQGFQVETGQKSTRIETWIPVKKTDEVTGEKRVVGKRPRTASVFCRHQVKPKGEAQ